MTSLYMLLFYKLFSVLKMGGFFIHSRKKEHVTHYHVTDIAEYS